MIQIKILYNSERQIRDILIKNISWLKKYLKCCVFKFNNFNNNIKKFT
jgi:hypothetical protein